jgi:hypothetical protein
MAGTSDAGVPLEHAVHLAADYLKQIYPNAEQGRVEEVELSDDDQLWLITLGFLLPEIDQARVEGLAGGMRGLFKRSKRIYKVFKIDRKSGEVKSMKIREPLHV